MMAPRKRKTLEMERRERHFAEMARILRKGKMLGYPACCVAEAILAHDGPLANLYTDRPSENQIKANNGTGFTPCVNHADQIVAGTISLISLIHGRTVEEPFPDYG